jgi:hypothetical protein
VGCSALTPVSSEFFLWLNLDYGYFNVLSVVIIYFYTLLEDEADDKNLVALEGISQCFLISEA